VRTGIGFSIADGRMRPSLRDVVLGFAFAWTAEAAVATRVDWLLVKVPSLMVQSISHWECAARGYAVRNWD
jgi:hypothetical protein